jgi:hypothetical protein
MSGWRGVATAVAACAVAAVAGVLAWGEAVEWRASRQQLGHGRSAGGLEAVVVLGYGNVGHRANYLNRYRVRAGIRSIDPAARESVLVLCGGTVAGDEAEAVLMERYARDELGFTGPILLDETSRTTRENIRNAIPLIEDADSIKIVSNAVHAVKGRSSLWKQRPDLAERLARGREYRFGELTFVKPLAAYRNLEDRRRHGGVAR